MAKKENIESFIGVKFHYLTILKEGIPHITSGGNVHRTVLCSCKCGIEKNFQFSTIKNGNVKSCGCYSAEMARERMILKNKKHGMHSTSEYNTWQSIKKRCLNKNNKNYHNYGGRGISICDEWLNSFENFFNDMGIKPYKESSIERIDNNKGYSKLNCKWASKKEQSRNQRSNRLITYNNETKCVAEWIEILGITRYKLTK